MYHDTVTVLDSTKLQTYQSCPRQFFYSFVLGWRPDLPNIHLVYGQAFHKAMEALLKLKQTPSVQKKTVAYSDLALKQAIEDFSKLYDQTYTPEQDLANGVKNKLNTIYVLTEYVKRYKYDSFMVEEIEIPSAVDINGKYPLYMKIDAVVRDESGVSIIDHKTSARLSSSYMDQWPLKFQVNTYIFALYVLYPHNEVNGMIINTIKIASPPRIKKDGTPYATDKGCEFLRLPVNRTPTHMDEWLYTAQLAMDSIVRNLDYCTEKKAAETDILLAFPKNSESCTKYGTCPYHGLCCSNTWQNPLAKKDLIPPGFKVEFWDPRREED